MTTLEGGFGAGTLVQVSMHVFKSRQTYHLLTTEQEPGRVLVETDEQLNVTTAFRVDLLPSRPGARVTIRTKAQACPGLRGWFASWINPVIMRRIYAEELQLLADYAAKIAQLEVVK